MQWETTLATNQSALVLYVLEVSVSNLGSKTGYPDNINGDEYHLHNHRSENLKS
jgi:hypothetical protein